MNGNLGYLRRSGLAAWGFELPCPAVDISQDTAPFGRFRRNTRRTPRRYGRLVPMAPD
jgi:hypothetical protein